MHIFKGFLYLGMTVEIFVSSCVVRELIVKIAAASPQTDGGQQPTAGQEVEK